MFEVELQSHIQNEQHSGKETGEPFKKEKDAPDCPIGSDHSYSAVEGREKLKFSCSKCPYSSDRKEHLKRHLSTHTGERPHQCELCNKTFTRKCSLTRHIRLHTGKLPNVGDTCGKTKLALQAHEETHPEERSYPYICDACGKGFSKKSNFLRHDLTMKGKCHLPKPKEGNQKYCCTECPYSTDRKDCLVVHRIVHTRERPHRCGLCNKTFSLRATLMQHCLVHTGERPHVCDTCGRRFRGKSNLRRHNVMMKGKCHLPTPKEGRKKYRCKECPYSAKRSDHLKKHLLTHSGERPHQCELCNKTFSVKSNLKKHYRVHTGERPYVCKTCGKEFSHITSLRYHEVREHEVSQDTSSLLSNASE